MHFRFCKALKRAGVASWRRESMQALPDVTEFLSGMPRGT
jgi:hypothetical protein